MQEGDDRPLEEAARPGPSGARIQSSMSPRSRAPVALATSWAGILQPRAVALPERLYELRQRGEERSRSSRRRRLVSELREACSEKSAVSADQAGSRSYASCMPRAIASCVSSALSPSSVSTSARWAAIRSS